MRRPLPSKPGGPAPDRPFPVKPGMQGPVPSPVQGGGMTRPSMPGKPDMGGMMQRPVTPGPGTTPVAGDRMAQRAVMPAFKKGGMVSGKKAKSGSSVSVRGRGCEVRGTKACKMS